jgi:glucosylglycerate phosphorylase
MQHKKKHTSNHLQKISCNLEYLYGNSVGGKTFNRLQVLLQHAHTVLPSCPAPAHLSERDVILITYGDQLSEEGVAPLRTLANFCSRHLCGLISTIHLLPFYPYSSDDGFSVIDYRQVNPRLGNWEDIADIGKSFNLMFDAVINHVSAESDWFVGFLKNQSPFNHYFIVVEEGTDLSQVVRPRTLPLLTAFDTPSGQKSVWTTFSADQIDLNYRNPDVLLEIIDILLMYATRAVRFIRLDAIAYLWKEPGTSCIHLPQTHAVIRLLRAVLNEVAPQVKLITETNVPHRDNISYFGDGENEAQLVYNFALPPLVLHSLQSGNASRLTAWARDLTPPGKETAFFNFLASHDGIGLNPVRSILSEDEIDSLVKNSLACGGLVSYKSNPDGSQSPYELNINYFDALNPQPDGTDLSVQIKRFLVAQAILLALRGVPGIYFHSLFGSRGWPEGVKQSGQPRRINRQKIKLSDLEAELAQPSSRPAQVFQQYAQMLAARTAQSAFSPEGSQTVLDLGPGVFALLRCPAQKGQPVLCLHDVSGRSQQLQIELSEIFNSNSTVWTDLISKKTYTHNLLEGIHLDAYQVLWLSRILEGE